MARLCALLAVGLACGCTAITSTRCAVAGSPANRARVDALLQDYARREGLQRVAVPRPVFITGFFATYARYTDTPPNSIILDADDNGPTVEARLEERRRFRRQPSQRFTTLDQRLQQLFRRSYGDSVRISTQTLPP